MIAKAKPPITQRRFASVWSELAYLCKKIHYWLYARKKRGRAERYLPRLKRVLDRLPENDLAIIREEGMALLAELQSDLRDAIDHREREIRLTLRLHKDANSSRYDDATRAYLLCGRDTADLQQRQGILDGLKVQKKRMHFEKLVSASKREP